MFRSPDGYAVGQPVALFALTTLAIAIAWWWLGAPVALPPSPLAPGEKLYCVSYAPFRDAQNPLDPTTIVSPAQIDEDLALLSHYTDCVRTYAIENGLDKVPEIAQRYGIKVLFGLWVGNNPDRNREEIATGVALARKYPDVISAIVVGNEVLLRGEMSATDLGAAIRQVKSQVSQPVTYADVWEFWLRYAELQSAVDFVTIHILPYWEDFPLPAAMAAAHVDAIRKQVAAAIPNKEIVIGETGWPSAGRMREGARPSPSNQARVIEDTLALGKRENFHVNVIEAFDQPWKRAIEGATGAYWGIFDRATGALKFPLGGAVSDHPHWVVQALAGIVLAAMAFAAAWAGGDERIRRRAICGLPLRRWPFSPPSCSAGRSGPFRSRVSPPSAGCVRWRLRPSRWRRRWSAPQAAPQAARCRRLRCCSAAPACGAPRSTSRSPELSWCWFCSRSWLRSAWCSTRAIATLPSRR